MIWKFFVLAFFIPGFAARPTGNIFNGTRPTSQRTDTFLKSGHVLVNRLCQGPLGCGYVKTAYNSSYNPEQIYSHDYYGKTNTSEYSYTEHQEKAVGERDQDHATLPHETDVDITANEGADNNTASETAQVETNTTEYSYTEHDEKRVGEVDQDHENRLHGTERDVHITANEGADTANETAQFGDDITFRSNESLAEIDRAVNILCKGTWNCSQTRSEDIEDEANSEIIIIAGVIGGAITIVGIAIIGAVVCYRRRKAARADVVEEGDEMSDGFEFVDLTPPSPPPPPSRNEDEEEEEKEELVAIELGPIAEEEESRISLDEAKYIYDYGTGRYLQVTEL